MSLATQMSLGVDIFSVRSADRKAIRCKTLATNDLSGCA